VTLRHVNFTIQYHHRHPLAKVTTLDKYIAITLPDPRPIDQLLPVNTLSTLLTTVHLVVLSSCRRWTQVKKAAGKSRRRQSHLAAPRKTWTCRRWMTTHTTSASRRPRKVSAVWPGDFFVVVVCLNVTRQLWRRTLSVARLLGCQSLVTLLLLWLNSLLCQ